MPQPTLELGALAGAELGEKVFPFLPRGSAAAAAFGVQSRANRERDFTRGKPMHFIIAGIVFTAVFVLVVAIVVHVVLRNAT